jgi:hypothetical protein
MDEWDLKPPAQGKSRPPEAGAPPTGGRPQTPRTGARAPVAPMDGAIIMEPSRPDGGGEGSPPTEVPGAGDPSTPAPSGAGELPDTSEPGGKKAPPAPKRRGGRALLAWSAAALLLLVVGAVIGFAIARSQNADITADLSRVQGELGVLEKALSQAEERNWNYYRENQALKAALEAGQSGGATTSTTLAPGPGATYGDGLYLVGEDITPGTYDGVVTGEQGYWARLKGTDGQVGSIIANAIPREPFVLTITVSDKAVELRGVEITAR